MAGLLVLLFVACLIPGTANAKVVPLASTVKGLHGAVLWQLELPKDQCPTTTPVVEGPCYNVFAANASSGTVLWEVYTTDTSGIRSLSPGHRSVFLNTWHGPSLMALNPTSGHVRWEYPSERWKYWQKDIDLPPSASFKDVQLAGQQVFTTSAGPPSHLYCINSRTGRLTWEFKADKPPATITDMVQIHADTDDDDSGDASDDASSSNGSTSGTGAAAAAPGVVYVSLYAGGISWLQAINASNGATVWTSAATVGQLDRMALDISRDQLLMTNTNSSQILAFQRSNGTLLWQYNGSYCSMPTPTSRIYDGTLLLADSCDSMRGLTALDAATGQVLWSGWDAKQTEPQAGCSWHAVHKGAVLFGCNCGARRRQQLRRSSLAAQGAAEKLPWRLSSASVAPAQLSVEPKQVVGAGPGTPAHSWRAWLSSGPGVCLYSVDLHSGKTLWALPAGQTEPQLHSSSEFAATNNSPHTQLQSWEEQQQEGEGQEEREGDSFPLTSQAWGQAPVVSGGGSASVAFVTQHYIHAVDTDTGRHRWGVLLPANETLLPWRQPSLVGRGAGASELLLLPTYQPQQQQHAQQWQAQQEAQAGALQLQGHRASRTLQAIDMATGHVMWQRRVNGTAQQTPLADGARPLWQQDGRVVAEACEGTNCCLFAFNATTGRRGWHLCRLAERGTDATHPHAQFAIWLIMLLTMGSIALLIAGACLIYTRSWIVERRRLKQLRSYRSMGRGRHGEGLLGYDHGYSSAEADAYRESLLAHSALLGGVPPSRFAGVASMGGAGGSGNVAGAGPSRPARVSSSRASAALEDYEVAAAWHAGRGQLPRARTAADDELPDSF